MARLRPYSVAVFCAVTLFIWTNRIWLAWTNDGDTVARKIFWSVPITAFELAAIVVVVAMLAGVDRRARWFMTLVQVFAAATVLFWAIRMPMIMVNDHDLEASEEIAFKLVHSVLAIVSVSTAWFAWRAMRRLADVEPAEPAAASELADW